MVPVLKIHSEKPSLFGHLFQCLFSKSVNSSAYLIFVVQKFQPIPLPSCRWIRASHLSLYNVPSYLHTIKCLSLASLVAQWLRIRLPMQGTWVRALVREEATCCGATKPVCHNNWACALEPTSHNYWAQVPQLLKPTCLEPMLRNKRSHPMRSPRTAI